MAQLVRQDIMLLSQYAAPTWLSATRKPTLLDLLCSCKWTVIV